ncbi:MAG: hypothetical protein PF570_03630, partial [Candidatus Cloacimonetes bacterium]|nr:hypothetical protein [Candidatus Cloacimonadota bacterium]
MLLFSMLVAQVTLEMILSQEEETYYPTELVEFLQNIKNNPVNINTIAENDLYFFPWLSGNDIQDIILYRISRKITKLEDLTKIGIDASTVNELKDYITFRSAIDLKLKQTSRVEYHQPKQYLPSTLKYFQKTILTINNCKLGFISQKDEGEKNLFDYYSYFVEYHR